MSHTFIPHAVTVATFHEPEDAETFRHSLLGPGVDSSIHDERNFQRYFLMASPRAGLHVRVAPEEVESATAHLAQWEKTVPFIRRAVHCPACNSSRIEYPQMQRNFVLPNLVLLLSMLLRIQRRSYQCRHCRHTWVDEPSEVALKTEVPL